MGCLNFHIQMTIRRRPRNTSAWARLHTWPKKSAKPSLSCGPIWHGSSHFPPGFLSDAFFSAIPLPDGSNHCHSRRQYFGAPNLVCKIWRCAQDEWGRAPSSVSSRLIRTHEDSRDVVLFGVMPEGAVTHPEQLRGTRSHAATGLQGRHEVGSFRLLHILHEIESSLGYL